MSGGGGKREEGRAARAGYGAAGVGVGEAGARPPSEEKAHKRQFRTRRRINVTQGRQAMNTENRIDPGQRSGPPKCGGGSI